MATPSAGPMTGRPSIVTLPSLGVKRPEMMRRSVDLPEPDRPRSATISLLCRFKLTLSSTSRLPVTPRLKKWRICWTETRGCNSAVRAAAIPGVIPMSPSRLLEPQTAISQYIKPAPKGAVQGYDEHAHHAYAEHDAMII